MIETDCKKENSDLKSGVRNGLLAALIPHLGCITLIVLTLLGVSFGTTFLKSFLSRSWAFPVLIAVSFAFAGASTYFFLRRNCCKNKVRYVSVLLVSVLAVNGLLLYVVFPWVANLGGNDGRLVSNLQELRLKVSIPCTGHAPLIVDELKKIGVGKTVYSAPDIFDIKFDSQKVSREEILGLAILKEFKAIELAQI